MQLLLKDPDKLCDASFMSWLLPQIRLELKRRILSSKFDNWDQYFTTIAELSSRKDATKEILLFAADHLRYYGAEGNITVRVNNLLHVPNCPSMNLETVVRQITYGNLTIKGCSIFKDVFDEFESNLDLYLAQFYKLGY